MISADRTGGAAATPIAAALHSLRLDQPGRRRLSGAPEGFDGRILAALAGERDVLHVCLDDLRLARLSEDLAFFDPDLPVIAIPAWDCLPYDRVSPHRDIVARRIDGLSRLATAPGRARLILTTVAGFLQRLPPRASFETAVLELAEGGQLAPQQVTAFLAANGYSRSANVAEAGEFALRGGIIDLFPPGSAAPLRIDFFGDEIESIREFDPLSQRSTGKLKRFTLRPVSELRLDTEAIQRFLDSRRHHALAAPSGNPGAGVLAQHARTAGAQHRHLRVRACAGGRNQRRQDAVPDPPAASLSELAPPLRALIP